MDIPESISSASSLFSLQAGRDLLTALQAQDQPKSSAVDFTQALESVNSITDTLEILPSSQALNADPTASALFQAHLGALASSQVLADSALSAQEHAQPKVMGITASTAAGPFANGESSQPDDFWLELPRVEPAQASRYPAAANANSASGTYGVKMNFHIGARMDLKG